jgi:hypothetical protein
MKGSSKLLSYSIWISIIITVFSSFVLNKYIPGEFPAIRFTSDPLLGVNYWGYPLGWLKQEVYPEAPKLLIWQNFVIDLVVLTLIVFLMIRPFVHIEVK